jgi:hypothetical protein
MWAMMVSPINCWNDFRNVKGNIGNVTNKDIIAQIKINWEFKDLKE